MPRAPRLVERGCREVKSTARWVGGAGVPECSAGLLHSLLAGCAADLFGWRGACAAAAARGVPPRASRTVELRRAGRGALWYGMVPEAVCRRLQKAQTVSEVRCGARVEA